MTPDDRRHPDAERLAEYAEWTLAADARAEVERHLAECGYCRAVVMETVAFVEESPANAEHAPAATMIPFRSRRWLTGVAAGLAAAAAILLVIRLQPTLLLFRGTSVDPRVVALVDAVGDQRTVEARLTGGFRYGPLHSTTRGSGRPSDNLSLLAASGRLQKAAAADRTPTNLHPWGVAQLLLGQHDEAVSSLEEAAAASPSDALIQTDLSAAYLARFSALGRADDLPKALDAASRARDLTPGLPEALFAYALALEDLHLVDRSREAWRAYLAKDATSGWADEARRRLAALDRPSARVHFGDLRQGIAAGSATDVEIDDFVNSFTDEIPDFLIVDLFGPWAEAAGRGESDLAQRHLATARRVARAFATRSGDSGFLAVINTLATAPKDETVAAVRTFGTGARILADDRYQQAEPALEEARRLLGARIPLLAAWATFDVGRVRYAGGKLDEAVALVDAAGATARQLDHPVLVARATWIRGIIRFSAGRWADARADYNNAVEMFESQGNPGGAAAIYSNLSILYRFLGERENSWRARIKGLASAPRHRPSRYHGVLVSAAASASLDGFDGSALVFITEAVSNAEYGIGPHLRAETRLQRAKLYARIGKHDLASQDLAAAGREWARITDGALRNLQALAIKTAAAQVYQLDFPAAAIAAAHEALALASARQDTLRSAEIHLYLGRALAKSDDLAGARGAIDEGIADFERARELMAHDDAARLSSFEPVWDLFDEAVALQVDHPDTDVERAFAAFQRGRARTLLEARALTPHSLRDVQAAMDRRTTMVMLHQRDAELLAWYITRETSRVFRLPLRRGDSRRLVEQFRRSLERGADNGAGRELTRQVLTPVLQSSIDGTLIVVPDEPYGSVAWAALPDSADHPLIERRAIVISPAASWVLVDGRRSESRGRDAAFILGAPAVPDDLAPLPGALVESAAVARLYARSEVRVGVNATPTALTQFAPSYDVVHIAAHAVESPVYPLLSRLLLAPDADGRADLSVQEIVRGRRLRPDTVVVLATCSSIGGGARRGEGSVGLAWAYLWLGARTVIGTLWEIDDAQSEELFVEFHRQLRQGKPPAEALRHAQLRARARGVPAVEWAAVQAIGRT